MTKQDRVVIRLSARPEISETVKNFRREHSDWPTLVHYLLYKNTSGKWKTSEQKRKASKRKKGDLPFPVVDVVASDSHVESTMQQCVKNLFLKFHPFCQFVPSSTETVT